MLNSKHRVISLILVVILAVSAFGISGFSAFAATTEESTSSADGTLVYFKNSNNWSPVKIHYWTTGSSTTWPGESMALVDGTTDVYYYVIPTGNTGVIFNGSNGSVQTTDLTIPSIDGQIYDPNSNSWSDYSGPTPETTAAPTTTPTTTSDFTQPITTQPATQPEGENVVYCQNDAGWSTVYAYMWTEGGSKNGSWPGVAMSDLGDGVWCYEVTGDYAMIIFNGGSDANKTADLNYPGSGQIYNNKTGKWDVYDTSPIRITSLTTDSASPQYTGMNIQISATAKSTDGTVSYKFSVTNKATSQSIVLSNYGSASSVVWTPTAVGEYEIKLDVVDTKGNTNSRTMNYSIADASTLVKPLIKSISPSNNGQIQVNTSATVTVNAGGGNTGTKLLFYKYIVTDPDGNVNVPYYTLSKTYQFTPTKLGEYTVQAFVQGSDNQTVNKTYKYSSVGQVVTTTAPVTIVPPPTTDPTQPEYEIGDVDMNGEINIRDATLIQMYLAFLTTFTDQQIALADFDGSGSVNVRDATAIQLYLVGLN